MKSDSMDQGTFEETVLRHSNHGLFADNYLENHLPALLRQQSRDRIEDTFKAIEKLYRSAASSFTPNTNEPQTEEEFIKPVLEVLWSDAQPRDCIKVQPRLTTSDEQRQPDYAFFRSPLDRQSAEARPSNKEFWSDVTCLGDAKKWFASLDRERKASDNPSTQIGGYLWRSSVRWGILTNGRLWRLYEREKASIGGLYYEVSLEDILRARDIKAFEWFYFFFRREAFLPDEKNSTFLDKVLQGSLDYATEVGTRLKDSVYDGLRLLMNGFLESPKNGLDRADPDTVKRVHDNSLIVLYRLLFLLYAEDKKLLFVDHPVYKDHSLKKLQQEINGKLRKNRIYYHSERRFWHQLLCLFELIDKGLVEDGKVIIPPYNGGLFSCEHHPHIAYDPVPEVKRWEIGDSRLAEVIDTLAYQREKWDQPGTQDIDYNTLAVQHLGSIYEGLLELQPQIADEPLIEAPEDGRVVFKPEREVTPRSIRGQEPRRIATGEVCLVTNRGERKATGSYYTPKYIVDYIVENTVGPIADEAARRVAELRTEVDREISALQRKLDEWSKQAAEGIEAARVEAKKTEGEIARQERRLLEPYLSLRILDPAMGSGHFLVGAADFLSLAMATDPNLPSLPEMNSDDPQAFYKRLAAERCLYGVDLNPLSVELAKLSLWLHTVSRNKALSFLDHHLRCGNSLIGARVEQDLSKEPPRLTNGGKIAKSEDHPVLGFYETLQGRHLKIFLEAFHKIQALPSGNAQAERAKEILYTEMDAVREKYRAIANCWLAPYFDAPVSADQYDAAVRALRGTDEEWRAIAEQPWFQDAQRAAREKRFFHWELEFLEAFFAPDGLKAKDDRGFDAVIGNPPYVRPHNLGDDDKKYLWDHFRTFKAKSDLYVCFIHVLIDSLKPHSSGGMIVSKGWLYLDSFDAIRDYILGNCAVRTLVELGGAVFPGAAVDTMVFTVSREVSAQTRAGNQVWVGTPALVGPPVLLHRIPQNQFAESYKHTFDLSLAGAGSTLKEKMQDTSLPLGELATVDFGLKTGDDATFLKDKSTSADDKPLLRGEDIFRYGYEYKGEYVWYVPRKMREHKSTARPGEPERFECRKLLVKDTSSMLGAALDDSFYYVKDVLIVHSIAAFDARYVLALLNSRLMSYHYLTSFPTIHVQRNELSQFPIRRIDFTTPEAERARLVEEGKALYAAYPSTGDMGPIMAFVAAQLENEPERADVIHDLLAFLAERMILLNKERQAEEQDFLKWLEREIKAKVDDLPGKSKIRDYHRGEFEDLLEVLRRNRGKIARNPEDRSFQSLVEGEFEKSVAKLSPLKVNLTATDALIDEIVYKLYGLTDDEIAIVKGN